MRRYAAIRRGALAVVLAGEALVARRARADASQDKAVAEALFRDGKQLLEAGDVDGACPKLAESFRVDATLGTLLFLAACHEQQGRTASAWSEFSSALSWSERSNQPERIAFARKHLQALDGRLSFLVIRAPAIPGLELKVDDALLSAAAIGTPLPLDPGPHALEASAPGRARWQSVVRVPTEPERIPLEIPELQPAAAKPSSAATPLVETTAQHEAPPAPPPAPEDGGRRAALWSAVGVTVAGVAVGSVFGLLTFGARDSAHTACPDNRCQPGGLDDISRAKMDATISTVGFGVGAAGAVVAAYFLFTGARQPSASAVRTWTIEPGLATISLRAALP